MQRGRWGSNSLSNPHSLFGSPDRWACLRFTSLLPCRFHLQPQRQSSPSPSLVSHREHLACERDGISWLAPGSTENVSGSCQGEIAWTMLSPDRDSAIVSCNRLSKLQWKQEQYSSTTRLGGVSVDLESTSGSCQYCNSRLPV